MGAARPSDSRGPIVKAALLAVIPAIIALGLAVSGKFVDEVTKALYAGAGTLIFGGLLGGMLKLLLDDVALKRGKRADAATFVGNVLQDLKSVHDRVERTRILISAHQSAKTYGDEMRDLIDAQVQLANVVRALERRADGIRADTSDAVRDNVTQMRDYLKALTTEFVKDYKPIADLQRLHEKRVSLRVEQVAKSNAADTTSLPNEPWEELLRLPTLRAFVQSSDAYEKGFGRPLDSASIWLRRELAWIHGAAWKPSSSEAPSPEIPPPDDAAGSIVAGATVPSVMSARATLARVRGGGEP